MNASPTVLYRAWTEHFDRWFAAPGAVLMTPAVNEVCFWEVHFEYSRYPHYGRFLRLERDRLVELTWVSPGTKGYETVLTVELSPAGRRTRLHITHAGFPDEASRAEHEQAWPDVLKQLDHRMAGERTES